MRCLAAVVFFCACGPISNQGVDLSSIGEYNEFIVRPSAGINIYSISEVEVIKAYDFGSFHVRMKGDAAGFKSFVVGETPFESLEPNATYHAFDVVPNDPKFGSLWGMNRIEAPKAWDIHKGSSNVVVGVIDTGIDYNHEDLRDNYWRNPGETGFANGIDKSTNGIDDDNNGYIDDFRGWDFANNDNDPIDDQGHGTHCAGTIAARGNNGVGVAGVSWNAKVVGIKFLTKSGSGTLAGALSSIEYGSKIGVDVLSNSWGGGGFSAEMKLAIERAMEKDILFVAAAGNESNDNSAKPAYPASYGVANVISVAATLPDDKRAYFSNYGPSSVHIAAPGDNIYSTAPNNGYRYLSGTSMATPHVSGAAALLLSYRPGLTFAEAKALLLERSDKLAGLQNFVKDGNRLNIFKLLQGL